jgi:hypothetical protein
VCSLTLREKVLQRLLAIQRTYLKNDNDFMLVYWKGKLASGFNRFVKMEGKEEVTSFFLETCANLLDLKKSLLVIMKILSESSGSVLGNCRSRTLLSKTLKKTNRCSLD